MRRESFFKIPAESKREIVRGSFRRHCQVSVAFNGKTLRSSRRSHVIYDRLPLKNRGFDNRIFEHDRTTSLVNFREFSTIENINHLDLSLSDLSSFLEWRTRLSVCLLRSARNDSRGVKITSYFLIDYRSRDFSDNDRRKCAVKWNYFNQVPKYSTFIHSNYKFISRYVNNSYSKIVLSEQQLEFCETLKVHQEIKAKRNRIHRDSARGWCHTCIRRRRIIRLNFSWIFFRFRIAWKTRERYSIVDVLTRCCRGLRFFSENR